jgi:probable phosphoglycerate mutase
MRAIASRRARPSGRTSARPICRVTVTKRRSLIGSQATLRFVTSIPPEGFRQHRFSAPPGAATVLLVRHGESWPAHPERPFPLRDGHGDPPLDPVGVEQAEQLADRLQHEPITAIYVTTLQRTHQTAEPLAARLGLTVQEEPDLREVFLGDWEGGAFRQYAVEGHPIFEQIWREERWDVIPGAENHDEFDARVWRGLTRIVAAHPDELVMVVSHGGVIGHLLHRVTSSRRFAFSGADNASISELVATPDRIILRRYNDVSHLAPPASD